MTDAARGVRAAPFFLAADPGQRLCIYYPPADGPCRGAILYVPPFAEEMNKSRRMAALQARALSALGYGVLLIDLYGCGDSSGDFADARWDIWKRDLACAHRWLQQRLPAPVSLWGLRLGALLALDYAAEPVAPVHALALWQPVQSGKTMLTQFLRLRVANEMLNEGGQAGTSTQALRAQLHAGATLEIAGYALAAPLALAIDALEMSALTPRGVKVDWFEAVGGAGQAVPPGAARVAQGWQAAGADFALHALPCPAFWSAQEITECPALLAATSAVFEHAP
ncbi:MAG: hydrolase 2, exosortase A system-associated [Pseudomonadota bacterium]|nr:hydrolase 2, exosortase A system-associated [Pseudomonadota bacterium]MDL2354151.1 hydrolase 2, exosortase A system-associated [Pseudomonadota bacterium]